MQPDEQTRSRLHLLAVFPTADTAREAQQSLRAAGVPADAIEFDDPGDETSSLRAEMREELDDAWVLPQAAFIAPKEGARSFVVLTAVTCVVGAIVGVPLAFIDFGMTFWTRLLLIEGLLVATGVAIGLVLGPSLGVKRPNEPMAAQRGITVRVRQNDAPTRACLSAFNPVRLDEVTVDGEPVSTVATEEDRAGGQGVYSEIVKATSEITDNLSTDDYQPPTHRSAPSSRTDRGSRDRN